VPQNVAEVGTGGTGDPATATVKPSVSTPADTIAAQKIAVTPIRTFPHDAFIRSPPR